MSKRLGQHFLINTAALKKIAAALEIKPGDIIVEIGPGHGELTKELRSKNKEVRVIAIEKDRRLAEDLRRKFADGKNVEIAEGDALRLLPSVTQNLKPITYKVAGNIPYYITGHLLRVIGCLEPKPERCVFTVQKEVAERLAAQPPRMNRMAASVQFWAEPKILFSLPKSDFYPPPKVNSTAILFITKEYPKTAAENYYRTVKILFRQPRKTLLNNLIGAGLSRKEANEILERSGLSPDLRSQNLNIQDILRVGDDLRAV